MNTASLPLILSGPILRRVTAASVCVFVALKYSCRVTPFVYDASVPGTHAPVAQHSAMTLPLGKHLHVAAIEATLPDGQRLEPNKIYEYDLRLDYTDDAGQATSAELGDASVNLLAGETPLGYETGRLPSFALPPDLTHLNILHGSCRKPHAGGRDMLACVDQLIERSRNDPLRRPHQLLLTGDQIYADDVSVCLLKALTEVGEALLEWTEKLPPPDALTSGDERLRPGARRGEFIKEAVRYTTSETDGHLTFLSEFYAMYLMVWSDALWPSDFGGRAGSSYTFPTPRETLGDEGAEATTLKEYLDNKRRQTTQRKAEADRRRLLSFARTLPKVRRALANVPTYMIFDDHEVTDDWSLNGKWAAEMRANPASKRLMRNALLAYAIFQDWGNRPREYATGTNGAKLLAEANGGGGAPPLNDAALDELLDLSPHQRAERAKRMIWNYQTSGPQHQIIALDTRTWRDYAGPDSTDAAGQPPRLKDIAVELAAPALHLGGADGVLIQNARLVGTGIENLFKLSPASPLTLSLTDEIILPQDGTDGGFGVGLEEAKFTFTSDRELPAFDVGGLRVRADSKGGAQGGAQNRRLWPQSRVASAATSKSSCAFV